MNTMVERVARAMAANDSGPEGSALFDLHWQEFGEGYTSSALAAIKAMREPSERMIRSAQGRNLGIQAWQAMIDAALSEGGE